MFTEPSVTLGRFNATTLDYDASRIIAGLGTARISLFNGEVYGGTLWSQFTDPTIPALKSGLYGGRMSWFPTRFITVTGAVEQTLGTTDFNPASLSPGSSPGSITKTNTAKLNVAWTTIRNVTLDGRLVFRHFDILNSARQDHSVEPGLAVTYSLNPRAGIVVDLSHVQYYSNIPGVNYTRNLISVGGKTTF